MGRLKDKVGVLYLFFSVLGLFLFLPTGGAENFIFEQVSMRQGLSQTTAKAVLRDQLGFLWIGTKRGLNRFDGKEMRNYLHDDRNPLSLPDNYIYFVTQDSAHNIWVGTGKGIVRYDRQSDSFFPGLPDNPTQQPIYTNFLVMGDSIVFGSASHLLVFNPIKQQYRKISFDGDEKSLPPAYSMVSWDQDTILIASRWKGLYLLNVGTGVLSKVDFSEEKEIMSVFLDSSDRLWISCYRQGVKVYNRHDRHTQHYHTNNSGLSNDIVLSINEIDGQIWLGTDGGGVNILQPETGVFTYFENIPEDQSSIPVNSISLIYEDQLSGIWLGTIRGGVFGVKRVNISSYSDVPMHNHFGLSSQTVLNMYEDEDGLWIGTDGGGINRYSPITCRFTHFAGTFKMKVNAMTGYSRQKLLVCCFGEGLKIFNKVSGRLEDLPLTDDQRRVMPGQGFVGVSLRRLADDRILLLEDNVYFLNPINGSLRIVEVDGLLPGEGELKLAGGNEQEGLMLFGLRGIYCYHKETDGFKQLFRTPDGMTILCVCRDKEGIVWLGTSDGLYRLDSISQDFEPVKTDFSHEISVLLCGENDQLWIGSGSNLYCYYMSRGVYRLLGRSDGVMDNEYLTKAALRSNQGDLYLGGVMGLVRVRKEFAMESTTLPVLRVSEILQDGGLISSDSFKRFLRDRKIVLPWDYKAFQVKVIVKDQDIFNEKFYRYKVEGYSKQFVETSSTLIDLSNLPSGEFRLMTMTSDQYGQWSSPIEQFDIIVLPPWWLSWWFVALLSLALCGVVIYLRYTTLKRRRNRSRLEVAERERMLNEQKVKFLVNISHEFRTPLSLIFDPLQRILHSRIPSDQQKPLLQLMFRQVGYLKNLVDQLLDINRIEEQGQSLSFRRMEFNSWLEQVVHEFDFEFDSRGIRLEMRLDQSIGLVDFDPDACKKVVNNFLMNALKYASESKRITISTICLAQNQIRVSVQDEGPGVPEDDQQRLFDRFYQANHSMGGIGVGLSFCQTLIALHHGKLGVFNAEPQGAVFYFDLPLVQNSELVSESSEGFVPKTVVPLLDKGEVSVPEDEKMVFLKELSVLIVEDDLELLNYVRSYFKTCFAKVFVARNGKQALEILNVDWPDIVVSDVMMPEMDGFELCRLMKSDLNISHIPVVLLTARQDNEGVEAGYKMGADGYMSKPFSLNVLISLIYNLLMGRRRMKEKFVQSHGINYKLADVTHSNADEEFLSRLNDLIHSQIDNPELNVDMLAEQLSMSRATLYAKFKAILDLGINAYMNDLRMQEAMRLLVSTDLPIADVAVKVGMTSQSYFSTLFKQVTGKTPLKYRQEYVK